MDTPVYYKAFRDEMQPINGSATPCAWSMPVLNPDGTYTAGAWMPALQGTIALCKNGYHGCERKDILEHQEGSLVFMVEYRSYAPRNFVTGASKVCGRQIRLVAPTYWDAQRARLFACDCAMRVIHLIPEQERAAFRRIIEVARRFAHGQATRAELESARESAWASAWESAWASARESAWASARESAWASAWASAWESAWASAWESAWASAWASETAWQLDRLGLYLHSAELPVPVLETVGG